jgi:hypothetical protein
MKLKDDEYIDKLEFVKMPNLNGDGFSEKQIIIDLL